MSLTKPSNLGIRRVQAAVVDGRCRNVRYRQKQLEALHNGLLDKASVLCLAAIKDNCGKTSISAEVEAEFCMAMDAVRYFYEGLDFEGELKKEYSVAAGKDNTTRRAGVGLVVIRPTNHTRLYSILSSISAAVAAGNCVILELQSNLLEVDAILKELLPKALDRDIFFISTTKIESKELGACTLVDQESTDISVAPNKDILSSSRARVIAVVDRSADIDAAARTIVHARFSLQGTSPYAPDLVVVNEFVKKSFVEACVQYASKQFAAENEKSGAPRNSVQDIRKTIQEAESKRDLSTFGSSQFMLIDISNRNTALANMKITGRYLAITSCTSMSDAVAFQNAEAPFLAGYFFGKPEAGNFLSQNINCHIAFINQIPLHLQFGPAASIAYAPSIPYRYSTDMFSVPRPQFVEPPSPSLVKISALLEDSDRAATRQLRSLALTPLKAQKQPLGKAIGFFEQGILIGLSVTLLVVVPTIGYGSYIVGRKVWGLVMRKN